MPHAESRHVVVIIGGAVAGSEAAFQLASRGVLCAVIEQHDRPYGKIEDGLPRWHLDLRLQEERRIDEKLMHPGVHYIPRIRLGRDLDLAEITSWGPSAIILANGAWRDRPLPLPGIEAYAGRGFAYQNPFVYWFNHYQEPGYTGPCYCPEDGAVVIGGGLASLDVMKILMLETVGRALAKKGHNLGIVELERKGCRKTLEELNLTMADLGLRGCTLIYRRRVEDMPVAELPEGADPEKAAKAEATRRKLLRNFADKYLFCVQGLRAPVGFVARNGRLTGLRIAETRVDHGRAHNLEATAHIIPTPLVISSIGSVPEPISGIEMVGERYLVKDQRTGELEGSNGIFVIGNAVTGKGNILFSRRHGRTVSQRMLEQYLHGTASGYEEVFASAGTQSRERMRAVAERLSGQAPLPAENVKELMTRIRSLQRRAGYTGDYRQWIEESRYKNARDFSDCTDQRILDR